MKKYIFLLLVLGFSTQSFSSDYFLIKNQNGDKIKVTTEDMEKMPPHSIITSTNFTPRHDFTGVEFKVVMDKFKLKGDKIRVFSLDDYSFTIPIDEMVKYNVIIAYKKDGGYISVSELGPFAIIYPRDQHSELNDLSVNAKMVWQIKMIEVK